MADEQLDDQANDGLEYEEITSDEVDRVVEQLERLSETVKSENIKSYIEDAINSIFFLVYEEDEVLKSDVEAPRPPDTVAPLRVPRTVRRAHSFSRV